MVLLFRQLRFPLIFAVAFTVLSPVSGSIGNEFTTGIFTTEMLYARFSFEAMEYGTSEWVMLLIGVSALLAVILGSLPVRFVTRILVEPPLGWMIKPPTPQSAAGMDTGVPRDHTGEGAGAGEGSAATTTRNSRET